MSPFEMPPEQYAEMIIGQADRVARQLDQQDRDLAINGLAIGRLACVLSMINEDEHAAAAESRAALQQNVRKYYDACRLARKDPICVLKQYLAATAGSYVVCIALIPAVTVVKSYQQAYHKAHEIPPPLEALIHMRNSIPEWEQAPADNPALIFVSMWTAVYAAAALVYLDSQPKYQRLYQRLLFAAYLLNSLSVQRTDA